MKQKKLIKKFQNKCLELWRLNKLLNGLREKKWYDSKIKRQRSTTNCVNGWQRWHFLVYSIL